jgi:hypothetical protein
MRDFVVRFLIRTNHFGSDYEFAHLAGVKADTSHHAVEEAEKKLTVEQAANIIEARAIPVEDMYVV